jgi:hypothetical protein
LGGVLEEIGEGRKGVAGGSGAGIELKCWKTETLRLRILQKHCELLAAERFGAENHYAGSLVLSPAMPRTI